MARLFIPQVGNHLKLTSNWDCKVFNESRNSKVFSGLNIDVSRDAHRNTNIDITFPKGTVLRVDRLYVRAPASSFDSITFTITSCPIKALVKARFWVKLMDANKIEFEEIIDNMDSHTKLKDLYRFVALSNNFQNSVGLELKDVSFISKEIYSHFNAKNNNAVKAKVKISAEELFSSIQLELRFTNFNMRDKFLKYREEAISKIENIFNELEITVNFLPVLDGWIYFYEENAQSILADKALGLYGREDKIHGRCIELGSCYSKDFYIFDYDKKSLPKFVGSKVNQGKLDEIYFEYQGKEVNFKNQKELDKFLKSIRVEVPKK